MTIALADRTTSFAAATVEREAREIGRNLFAEVGRGPTPRERAWWDDRVMALTMGDPEVKVQLFRFIDALPSLPASAEVGRLLREYLAEAGSKVPWFMNLGVNLAPIGSLRGDALASIARLSATHMARKFIAGSTPAEAFRTVRKLRRRGVGFTADLLGEAVISDREAEAYAATCVELLEGLGPMLAREPEIPHLDRAPWGVVPRCNLSLKLTSLTPRFDATFGEATARRVLDRLRPILRVARAQGAFVNVDMEQYSHKDLTFAIFKQVLDEPEFRDWADVGVVVQAYMPEAEADLAMLRDWAAARGTPVTIRLVKGAYWDYEVLRARQLGWPIPVYLHKWESDAGFERCALFLMENHEVLRPALGSHNLRSLSYAMAAAEALRVPDGAYEIQMLHGMGTPAERALTRRGRRVRVYTPYGAMLPGMAYLVRRLLENTPTSRSSRPPAPAAPRSTPSSGTPRTTAPCGRSPPRSRPSRPAPCPPSPTSRSPTSPGRSPRRRSAARSTPSATTSRPAPTAARSSSTTSRELHDDRACSNSVSPVDTSFPSRRPVRRLADRPWMPNAADGRRASAAFDTWSGPRPSRERADVPPQAWPQGSTAADRWELVGDPVVVETGKPWRRGRRRRRARPSTSANTTPREMVRLDLSPPAAPRRAPARTNQTF